MKKARRPSLALMAMPMLVLLALSGGCSDRDPAELDMARAPIDPLVFGDDYNDSFFQAFFETHVTAVEIDSVFAFGGLAQNGARSLKINVPPQGSSLGLFSGGVLTSFASRDLADFNALTFYARSSVPSTLNLAGFGNDNTGTSRYEASRTDIPLTTDWTFVVVPIPAPSKLIAERGLFTFAEGYEPQHPEGHTLWFDEIRFADLGNVTDPRPTMPSVTRQYFVGAEASLSGTSTTFAVDGADVVVQHLPHYFDFAATDPGVAEVEPGAEVTIVGEGSTTITATLAGTPVEGSLVLSGYAPPDGPAPTPTHPAAGVISMYSDAYDDVPVESWNPYWQWSTAVDDRYAIDGDEAIVYSGLNFVGVVFDGATIDASAMTHLHLDVFAPFGTDFLVKVVVFNETNGYAIGDAELRLDADTTPAFEAGRWSSLDIPLADFGLTESWEHVGQMVFSTADAELVLVDNVYWHD